MDSLVDWSHVCRLVEDLEQVPFDDLPARLAALESQQAIDPRVVHFVRLNFRLPHVPFEIASGTVLNGKYRLEQHLGQGGMGVVYRARHLATDRDVALKFIHPSLTMGGSVRRFEQEIRTLGKLEHRGIVQVYDADKTSLGEKQRETVYFAMEYVRGRSILEYARETELTVIERLELGLEICHALRYAHDRRVIHCDLKPSNIFCRSDGSAVILDFGLASAGNSFLNETVGSNRKSLDCSGTPAYMSPQRLREGISRSPDVEDDVYSLGVILYELLSDKFPFSFSAPQTYESIRKTVLAGQPNLIGNYNAACRGPIEETVRRAMHPDPRERYASATAVAKAIERLIREKVESAPSIGADIAPSSRSDWRPGIGERIPSSSWILRKCLGSGAVGEVWLADHESLKQCRAFKFCFDRNQVRLLKREMTVFRLLQQHRVPSIVQIHEVSFDDPPWYLMLDYVSGKDLEKWHEENESDPSSIVNLIATIAEGLQQVHDIGVIHRDIKPSNILVSMDPDNGVLCGALTDFGIGRIESDPDVDRVTRWGFTETLQGGEGRGVVGTQMYMAPELFRGETASSRSDIYSLGVVLFQSLVADYNRPITADWADAIEDPLLREDLSSCLAADPRNRFSGADQLACRLRQLDQRREARCREQAKIRERERLAYRAGALRTGLVAVFVGLILLGVGYTSYRNHLQANLANARLIRQSQREGQRFRSIEMLEQGLPWMNRGTETISEAASALALLDLERLVKQKSSSQDIETFFSRGSESHVIRDRDRDQLVVVREGRESRRLPGSFPDVDPGAVYLSPGGQLMGVAREASPGEGEFEVYRLDQEPPQLIKKWPLKVLTARFDGNEERVCLSVPGGELHSFELTGGRQLWQVSPEEPTRIAEYASVAFSDDGSLVAAASRDSHYVRVFESQSGQLLAKLYHRGPVNDLVWLHDRSELMAACDDGSVYHWDCSKPEVPITRRAVHEDRVLLLDRHPSQALIASASLDGSVRMWELGSKREVVADLIGPFADSGNALSFSSDGTLLRLARTNGEWATWRVHANDYFRGWREQQNVAGVGMLPEIPLGYVYGDEAIRFFAPQTGRIVGEISAPGLRSVVLLESPQLAVVGVIETGVYSWTLSMDTDRRILLVGAPRPLPIPRDSWSAAFSKEYSTLYVAHQNHVHVRDVQAHDLMSLEERLVEIPNGRPTSITLDQSGRYLVATTPSGIDSAMDLQDEGLNSWKDAMLVSRVPIAVADATHGDTFTGTLIPPNNRSMDDARVALWDPNAFVVAGERVFAVNGPNLDVYSAATRALLLKLSNPTDGDFVALDVAPKSRWLVSITSRNDVQIWDLEAIAHRLQSLGWPIEPEKPEDQAVEAGWKVSLNPADFTPPESEKLQQIKSLTLLINENEDRIKSLFLRGFTYLNLLRGDTLAESDFQSAMTSEARTVEELHYRGMASFYLGDYPSFVADLKRASRMLESGAGEYAQQWQLYLMLSRTLSFLPEKERDEALALRCAQRAVELKPSSSIANQILGFAYVRLGRFAEAIELFRPSFDEAASNTSPSFWYFCALAEMGLGREVLAREHFVSGEEAWENPQAVTQGKSLVAAVRGEVRALLKGSQSATLE